ncbi:hypothetical protein [Virgisporangium ochraceum]|uniref:Fibronectin type-III domain-containing protein n=1 Tax=Virgisporangium ochraceum TaxID=65505 RepID=A0A8J4A7Y2_9ACTN|nr:hypothetical protein [Virgisporangium ochraceum]GIJ75005.1 hypothetical protein Voc01_099220 [Virgisporangium ochraceum]
MSVTATNAAGTSAPSGTRQVAVPAAAPTPVVTARPGSAALVVSWEFPAGFSGRHTFVSIGLDPSGTVRVLALAVSVGGTAAGGAPAGGGGLAITGLPVPVLVLTGLGLLAAGAASRVVGSVPVRYGRRRRRA